MPGGGSGPGASRPSAFSSSRAGGLRPRPFSAAPAGRQQLGRPSALAVEGGVGLAKPDTAGGMGDLSGTIIGTSLGSQPSRGGGAAEGAPERQQGESEGEARTPVPAPAGAMLSSASAGHAPGLAVVFTGAGGSGRRPPPSRPFSAIPRMQAQRPMSGLRRGSLAGEAGSSMGPLARDSQLSSTPFDRAGTAGAAMGPEEREELIRRLTQVRAAAGSGYRAWPVPEEPLLTLVCATAGFPLASRARKPQAALQVRVGLGYVAAGAAHGCRGRGSIKQALPKQGSKQRLGRGGPLRS